MANESSVLVRLRLLGGQAFARQAHAAGAGLGSMEKRATAANARMSAVTRTLGASAAALRGIGAAAGVGAALGIASSVKASVGFEQSMANVQARLLTTTGNMRLLEDQAIRLGESTSFSARESADAMGELAAAGFSTQQIMRMMPGTLDLAAASGTDLAFAAEVSGAMIRQFGLGARDAGRVADVLTVAVNKSAIGMDDLALTMKYVGPVAGRFNQSIEDVGAAAAILGNVGIKGETAGTTLRRAFVSLVRPSAKTMDMLSGMGITTDEFSKASVDAKGNLRDFPSILGNLAGHFEDLSKPDQRRAITQLFGVEALPGMLTLFGKGEKGIRAMSAELSGSGGAAKRTAGIMRGTVAGAWDQFTGSIETAQIRLTKGFNPAIRDALKGAAGGVSGISAGLSAAMTGKGRTRRVERDPQGRVTKVTDTTSGPVKAGLAIREKLAPVFAWFQEQGPKVGSALADAGKQLLDAFAPAMPFISNVLLPLLKGIAIGVVGGVVAAFKIAVPVIRIVATALGWIGEKAAPVKGIIQGVGTVIGFFLGGPILKLLSFIPRVGAVFGLLGVPLRIANAAFRLVVGGVGRVIGVFLKAHTWVSRLAGTFTSVGGRIVRAAANFVGGVISRIESLIGRIRGLGGKFLAAGRGLIGKLFGGIRAAFSGAAGAMAGLGRMLATWLNEHTPLGDRVKAGPISFTLPSLATGGVVARGGVAVVGERGPELVNLPTQSTVYDAGQTRRARAAMASPAPMYANINLHLSGRQIHSEVFRIDQQLSEAT